MVVYMENIDKKPATPESVWEIIQELSLSIKESRAEFKQDLEDSRVRFEQEIADSRAEFKQAMAESRAEFDRRSAEFDRRSADSDRRIKNLDELIGGISKSNGMFAEEFFLNAIEMGDKQLFGEHFDECYSLVKRYSKENQKKGEHDILLVNGKSVAIVEVKYKARKEDIQKIINRLPNFRILFPEYKEHRIYLGLAALSFDKGVENESIKEGIAIVKQVGDMVVISDENLKTF